MIWLGALLMAADKPAPPPDWSANMAAAAVGANGFGFDLYKQAAAGTGSRFVSPYSVHAAFSLLTLGAGGATRDELVKVLQLPAGPDAATTAGDLGRYYTAGGKPYTLTVANALWGQAGYPWSAAFQKQAADRFGAALRPHDFKADSEGGRLAVNRWVEGKTNDRIKDLLPAGSVDPLTRLVVANAVYFKADWATPFKPAATTDQPFFKADGSKADVPLMSRSGPYRYVEADGVKVLELPYAGGELVMTVLLPNDPTKFGDVEAKLATDTVNSLQRRLADEPLVQVYLPKFRVEFSLGLPPALKALGITKVFDPAAADLSGLVTQTPEQNLYVSDAFHKAFVEVTEAGTEAAAATGVVVAARSIALEPKPKVFRADHPFVFLIRDVRHGTVLFVGRYSGPG
jgi:serpin B